MVPKSHKLEEGPWETLRRSFKSSLTLDAEVAQTDMPNHFRFACPGGTWMVFDQATWHAALPNTSGVDRRVVITGYDRERLDNPAPPLFAPEVYGALEKAGRMTEAMRVLTGYD